MIMRFLPNSEEILQAIREIQPGRLAVAYIGRDFDQFVNPEWIDQIVLSPTPGSNPHAIRQLVDATGWERIEFIPELHAKLYLGGKSAVVGSANLSRNGLDVGGLWEAGVYVDEPDVLNHIGHTVEQMFDQARQAYPTIDSKETALENLEKIWVPGTFPPRRAPRPIPEQPGASTLEEILATVRIIPEYLPNKFYIHIAPTELGRTTWRYLNAYQTIDLLIDAIDSGSPAVAGIDQQYHSLFQTMRAVSGVDDGQLKNMIGQMVRQVVERFRFHLDRQDVQVGGVFFQNGSTYSRIQNPEGGWQLRYWETFNALMEKTGSPINFRKPRERRYFDSSGSSDVGFTAVAITQSTGGGSEIRAELVIYPPHAKGIFEPLVAEKLEIESELREKQVDESLDWHAPANVMKKIIRVCRNETNFDESAWPDQHAWLKNRLEALHRVFKERVAQLH